MSNKNQTKRVFTLTLMIFISSLMSAKDYFVATDGSDNASVSKNPHGKQSRKEHLQRPQVMMFMFEKRV